MLVKHTDCFIRVLHDPLSELGCLTTCNFDAYGFGAGLDLSDPKTVNADGALSTAVDSLGCLIALLSLEVQATDHIVYGPGENLETLCRRAILFKFLK